MYSGTINGTIRVSQKDVQTDCKILDRVKADPVIGFILGLIDKSDWSTPVEDNYGPLGGAIMINLEVYNRFEGADAVLEAWNMHRVRR